jgi:uncharacterized protein Yka (UPF0111/DUF47 family)
MEQTLVNNLISLGIGGVVAAIVLLWKRQDDQRYAGELKALTERSLRAQEEATRAMRDLAGTIEKLNALMEIEKRLTVLEHKINRKKGGEK